MSTTYPLPPVVPWQLPVPDTCARTADYPAALARIYGYSERRRTAEEIALSRRQKLLRMRTLLALLGSPQARYATVLVAGTKGKGSMAAYLASILHEAGYRAGRYTQPHLYSYRERTWACGDFVTEQEVIDELRAMEPALALVEQQASDLGLLTTFDVGAAQTLLHFARVGVEIAVVEVGVGGANDATNALEPILGLIGPIGMDHVATIGPTLAHIAREKAGIMRRGIDVVIADQVPEAMDVLCEQANTVGVRLHTLGCDFGWDGDSCGGTFGVTGPLGGGERFSTPLPGQCQRENAAMALVASKLLAPAGWPVSPTAMRHGVARVSWPGRFQTVVRDPLTIVDGAHNEDAARALRACIQDCVPARPITLVLGMSAEKDAETFVQALAPHVERVITTRARHERATDPARLATIARSHAIPAEVIPSPADALCRAWGATSADGVVLVTGSLFLVGDVLEWLRPASAS